MKYSSNQIVRLAEHEFELAISKATLKTKFPCQLYTTLKYHPDLPELVSNGVTAQNGEAQFNYTHRFTTLLTSKNNIMQQHQVVLSLGVRSKYRPFEKIIAGFVILDLAKYAKYPYPSKIFNLERCPDQQSTIQICIKSNRIRQILDLHGEQSLAEKFTLRKSLAFREVQTKQRPSTKRSVAGNKSISSKQELYETTISAEFSKCLNAKFKQSGNFTELLTPDRIQNCQLSFAQLRDSVLKKSLNCDDVRTSVEILPSQFMSLEMENKELEEKNQQLYSRIEKSEKENARHQANINALEEELRTLRSKLSKGETVLPQKNSSHNLTERQLQCRTFVQLLAQERQSKSVGGIEIIQRNHELVKTIGGIKVNLQEPIRQIQQLMHNQIQDYSEETNWEALGILQKMAESLSIL